MVSAIARLKAAKSPGPDGFSAVFYKVFCNELAPFLAKLFNSFLETGAVTPSMAEATISVLLKPGKNPKECGSYRPISLLNIDAKLLASILAARIGPLMDDIIDPDQSGFVPTRQGGDNTKRLLHLIERVHRKREEACLLSIDAEKAFDRVNWTFLFAVLQRFGFGKRFLSWIQSLYASPAARVRVNGCLSPPFAIGRGTRQGCPLSPLLFAFYLEPLAQRIRDAPDIVGLRFGDTQHKLSLYADDIILSLTLPTVSLPALAREFHDFGGVAGFRINYSKSYILNLSVAPDTVVRLQQEFAFKWTTDDITYLGVRLATTIPHTVSLNYSQLLESTRTTLDSWRRFHLAWFGRVAAVKMTLLPRILYMFQMLSLTPPKGTLKQVQSLINTFIWNGKRPRLSLAHMIRPKAQGGLGLPSILAYYQATCLRYLVQWDRPLSSKHWDFMDQAVAGTNIWRELWLPRKHRAKNLYLSPITLPTLRAWDGLALARGWTTFPSPMTPIVDNPDFPPGIASPTFQRWREQGCKRAGSLFDLEGLLSFTQLQQDYGLRNSDLYPYTQLTHWVTKPDILPHIYRPLTTFERWLMRKETDRHVISELYAMIVAQSSAPRTAGQVRWETELGRPLTAKEWDQIWYRTHHTAHNVGSREAAYKIAHYWYFTPARVHAFNRTQPDLCWRGCGATGTLLHLLWHCPKLGRYWEEVLSDVNEAFQVTIPASPEHILLGLPLAKHYPLKALRGRQIALALLAAAQVLLAEWRSLKTPVHWDWLQRLWQILAMEKLTMGVEGKGSTFSDLWAPFYRLLSKHQRAVTCPKYLQIMQLIPLAPPT